MRRKRSKVPVLNSMGKLEARHIFKGKSRNPLLGWYRPQRTTELRPLSIDYSHR